MIKRYQAKNLELHGLYEAKKGLIANKHFTKSIWDTHAKIQRTVESYLEEIRPHSEGKWLLGRNFRRSVSAVDRMLQQVQGAVLIERNGGLLGEGRTKARLP